MTGKNRNYETKVSKLLQYFPCVALLGARQVGKSTLVKKVGSGWKYFDLEKPAVFDRISRDPDFFFRENSEHIILDEAQEFPEIFKSLRSAIDENRSLMGRFLITGSSSPELLKHVSESLAGRIAILEIGAFKANEFYSKPLSPFFAEFAGKILATCWTQLTPQLSVNQMQNFWLRGGYPEPILHRDLQRYNLWMDNYQSTYVNRDVRKLFPKLDIVRYRRFITTLAKLSGTQINKANLARAIEVSEPTIRDYLEIAHGTFIWRQLLPFEHAATGSIVKTPKGHVRDSGLLHSLLKLKTLDDLESDPIVGASFESFVVEEIIKGLDATLATNWSYHFYRTRGQAEIDLILDGDFGTVPIEIKLGEAVSQRSLKSLREFIDANKLPIGLLINCSQKVELIAPKILQIPIGCL